MAERSRAARSAARWLPAVAWHQLVHERVPARGRHLVMAIADHFEPSFRVDAPHLFAPRDEQLRRLEHWCRSYPRTADGVRDASGVALRHTYFSPAEQADGEQLAMLAAHCHDGWGEIEVQLHHGVERPDTAAATRAQLETFRDALVSLGCLSRWEGEGPPRYAFVHGNWALANSSSGRCCGVDDELAILADTGCYADFTLPSAPHEAQVPKVNAIYEVDAPVGRRAAHARGRDLRVGESPRHWPILVQGPLSLEFSRPGVRRLVPRIENGELSSRRPETMERIDRWVRTGVRVAGRPDWVFVKLHCHGMDSRDEDAMLGAQRRQFLSRLADYAAAHGDTLWFTTAREMVNIVLAACDGRTGAPGDWRDYRLLAMRAAR